MCFAFLPQHTHVSEICSCSKGIHLDVAPVFSLIASSHARSPDVYKRQLIYKQEMRSYRDLPLRVGELGIVHRHEKSGALHGLMRVRCFTQDDAHIFMTEDQIREEIKGVVNLIDGVYKLFGFKYHVELSTRPENSMGSDEAWEKATDGLRGALEDMGIDYVDVYKRQVPLIQEINTV